MIRNLSVLLGILLCLQACTDAPVFEQNKPVRATQWNWASVMTFDVHITRAPESFPVYVLIRNTGVYRYANLWMFVSVTDPDGKVGRDTVDFRLAAPSGHWEGKRVAGLYENKFLWRESYAFPDTGIYTFRFEQAMRDEELGGIHDVGLFIPGELSE